MACASVIGAPVPPCFTGTPSVTARSYAAQAVGTAVIMSDQATAAWPKRSAFARNGSASNRLLAVAR